MEKLNPSFYDISRFVQPEDLLFHDITGVIVQAHATRSHLYLTLQRVVLRIIKFQQRMYFKCNSVLCQGRLFTVIKLTENSKLGRLVEFKDYQFVFSNTIVNCEFNEVLGAQEGKLYFADADGVLVSFNPVTNQEENYVVKVQNVTSVFDRMVFTMIIDGSNTLCTLTGNKLEQILPRITLQSVFSNIISLRAECEKQMIHMTLLDGQLSKLKCSDKPTSDQIDYTKQQYFQLLQQLGSDEMQFNVIFYKEHSSECHSFNQLTPEQIILFVDELLVLGTKEALLIVEQFGIFNDEGNYVCFLKDEFNNGDNVLQYITSMIQIQLLISLQGFDYIKQQIEQFDISFQQLYSVLHYLHPTQQIQFLDSISIDKLKDLITSSDDQSIDIFEKYFSQHSDQVSELLDPLLQKLSLIKSKFLVFHIANAVVVKQNLEMSTIILRSKFTQEFQHQLYHTQQYQKIFEHLISNLELLCNEELTNEVYNSIENAQLLQLWNSKMTQLCQANQQTQLKTIVLWLRGMFRADSHSFYKAVKQNVLYLFPLIQQCDACFFIKHLNSEEFQSLVTTFQQLELNLRIDFFNHTEFSESQVHQICIHPGSAQSLLQLSKTQEASEQLQILQTQSACYLCFTEKDQRKEEKIQYLQSFASVVGVLSCQGNYSTVLEMVKLMKVQIYG